jgi:tetratricopeptide (TPR) repeat protein
MRRAVPEGPTPEEAAAQAAEEERARRVEVEFLEAVRARLPAHAAVVETLGCLYTEMGRYQDGLRADREMVRMEPHSPTAWYNLACSLALTEQADAAFAALEKAIALGYDDVNGCRKTTISSRSARTRALRACWPSCSPARPESQPGCGHSRLRPAFGFPRRRGYFQIASQRRGRSLLLGGGEG